MTATQQDPIALLDSITPSRGNPALTDRDLLLYFPSQIPFTLCEDYQGQMGSPLTSRRLNPLESLIATQSNVSYLGVKKYLEKIKRGSAIPAIQVLDYGQGKYLIWNGHHRATAHYLAGQPVPAVIFEFESIPSLWEK